jgi:two-component system response regulator EvgA
MDGLTAIGRLRGDSANTVTKILVLSAQNPQHLAMRCLHAGASGFVYKEKDLQELVTATRAVMQGNTYFPTEAMRPMCHGQGLDDENALISRLSNRELVVLQHLARGALNKTIAAALMLSEKTVSTYKSRLHEKLNTVSVLELTDLARRHGLA